MKHFRIGRIEGAWTNITPPIQRAACRTNGRTITTDGIEDRWTEPGSSEATSRSGETDGSDLSASIYSTGSQTECSPLRPRDILGDGRSDEATGVVKLHAETFAAQAVRKEIEQDMEDYPSLDQDTQCGITQKYRALHKRVQEEGYYDCRYVEYAKESIRYLALFLCFVVTLRSEWYITSACFLGIFWHQIMFTAHDAGHLAITHDFKTDTLIAIFIADFCCGLSMGWWKSSHNVHHLVTNLPVSRPHPHLPSSSVGWLQSGYN